MHATVGAIGELERSGFHGPFALALGNDLYLDANSPNQNSMVLASDRILPFLNGPLVRSGAIPPGEGVLVALAAEPVDLVVATDLELKYIQTTLEPRAVLRLRERFALRIKQYEALQSVGQKWSCMTGPRTTRPPADRSSPIDATRESSPEAGSSHHPDHFGTRADGSAAMEAISPDYL